MDNGNGCMCLEEVVTAKKKLSRARWNGNETSVKKKSKNSTVTGKREGCLLHPAEQQVEEG